MSIAEFKTLIESTGIPCAYRAFPENEAPALPFITWFQTGTVNFAADGVVYHETDVIAVELYTEARDLETEAIVETALKNGGIFWDKEVAYIDGELCYQTVYTLVI